MPVQAAPTMVPALSSAATTYSFFFADPNALLKRGVPVATAKANLTTQLAPLGITPCWTNGDLNSTNIRCGDPLTGEMQLENGAYYGYNLETLLLGTTAKLERGVRQLMLSNFLSPTPTGVVGDSVGRVGQVHFSTRVAQFGFLIDPGIFGTLSSIQFIVNDQALPPQPLTPGVVQFVGVEDSHGFTDVTLIASGITQSFVADHLAFLPLAKF